MTGHDWMRLERSGTWVRPAWLRKWWCRKVGHQWPADRRFSCRRCNAPQPVPADDWEPRSLALEWARDLLAKAELEERQATCTHGTTVDISRPGVPYRELLCQHCTLIIKESW